MNWKEIAEEVTAVGAGGDPGGDFAQPVTGVEYDSRKVGPDSVFVAMKGGSTDGNRYVEKAIASGALGIITDSAPKFDHLLVFQAGMPVLEVVKHTEVKRGFVLLPRRWVVERSFAWAARFRRLARDYERLAKTLAGLHYLAFAILMLANLARQLTQSQ
jgi:UDP-N-acetylmuramyl pentapeptide synthase